MSRADRIGRLLSFAALLLLLCLTVAQAFRAMERARLDAVPACELDVRDVQEICSDLGYMVLDSIQRDRGCRVGNISGICE